MGKNREQINEKGKFGRGQTALGVIPGPTLAELGGPGWVSSSAWASASSTVKCK